MLFLCLERQLVAIGFTSVSQNLPAPPCERVTGKERDVTIVSRILHSRSAGLLNIEVYFSLWCRGRVPALADTDLNLSLAVMSFPPNTSPGPLSVPPVVPPFASSPHSSHNERRSPSPHRPPLVGCADFALSRPARCHDIRKRVRYLINADDSGPFGFWSLRSVLLAGTFRRNSERARPHGDTVANCDVRTGYSCGSPFINYTSIAPHIKSSIRCGMPSLYLENVKSCFVYDPFSPPPIPLADQLAL